MQKDRIFYKNSGTYGTFKELVQEFIEFAESLTFSLKETTGLDCQFAHPSVKRTPLSSINLNAGSTKTKVNIFL